MVCEQLPQYTATSSQRTSLYFYKSQRIMGKPDFITVLAQDRKNLLYSFDCTYINNEIMNGVLEKQNKEIFYINGHKIFEFNLNILNLIKFKRNFNLFNNNRISNFFILQTCNNNLCNSANNMSNVRNVFYWKKCLDYKYSVYHPFSTENGREEQGRLDIKPEVFDMIDFVVATLLTTGAIKKYSPQILTMLPLLRIPTPT
ncbi:hypothetical protein HDU92_007270 [Lobulomyces angularis]|nr:hypothetical protein HDU92_007270 [Lobulomyces angularis]